MNVWRNLFLVFKSRIGRQYNLYKESMLTVYCGTKFCGKNGYELQLFMSFNVCGNKYWLPQTNSIGSNMKVLLFLLKLDHHIKIRTLKKKRKITKHHWKYTFFLKIYQNIWCLTTQIQEKMLTRFSSCLKAYLVLSDIIYIKKKHFLVVI